MNRSFRRFLSDQSGNAPLLTAFIIIAFFMLSAVLYNVFSVYSTYNAVRDELDRCTSICLDANIVNANLRDTITDVEYQSASDVLAQNLCGSGWSQTGSTWTKASGCATICRLKGMSVSVTGSRLHLTATAQIPLPMAVSGQIMVEFPVDIYARILYIE